MQIDPKDPNRYQKKAVAAAQLAYYEKFSNVIDMHELYVVWFSKTLQNWKALISTDFPGAIEGLYIEVTHNGSKNETYVDIYHKVSNHVIADALLAG